MPIGFLLNYKQLLKKIKYEKYAQWRADNPEDHKKLHTKSQWKLAGIIVDDFDKSYDEYIKTRFCEYCEKQFVNPKDRQMDHDHLIKDRQNTRGVICISCNFADVFWDYFDYLEDCY